MIETSCAPIWVIEYSEIGIGLKSYIFVVQMNTVPPTGHTAFMYISVVSKFLQVFV